MARKRQVLGVRLKNRSVKVPEPTWIAARYKAEQEGKLISEVVIELLFGYASS